MNVKAIRKRILVTKNGFEQESVHDPIVPKIKELIVPIERPEIVIIKPGRPAAIMADEFPPPSAAASTQSFYLDRVELIQVEIYKEI